MLGLCFPLLTEASKKAQYAKNINSCTLLQISPLRNKGISEKSLAVVPIWNVGKDIFVFRNSALFKILPRLANIYVYIIIQLILGLSIEEI